MKHRTAILTMLAVQLILASVPSLAGLASDRERDRCDVDLKGDIAVEPSLIRVTNRQGNAVEIFKDDSVFVDQKELDLSEADRTLLHEYASQVRSTVPEIVNLALDGVEIGLTAATGAFYTLTETAPPESLRKAIGTIKEKVSARMSANGDSFYLKDGAIGGLEDDMHDLQPAIQEAIGDAVGEVLIEMGKSLARGDGSLAERMAAMSHKMENLESEIKAKVGGQTGKIEERAQALCVKMRSLDRIEDEVHENVPALRPFNIVSQN